MGKIKGWKKTGKYYYRRIKDNALIQIGRPPGRNGWKVYMEILPRHKMRPIHKSIFYTSDEARKFAVNYMKSHSKEKNKVLKLAFDRNFDGKTFGLVSSGNRIYYFTKSKAQKYVKRLPKNNRHRIIKTNKGNIIYIWWPGRYYRK